MRSTRTRVALLLAALAVTAAWAYGRLASRGERVRWERTLGVLVYAEGEATPAEVDALRAELRRLEARLAEDRDACGAGPAPFAFEVVGPIAPERPPPEAPPPEPSWLERARFALELWRHDRAVRGAVPAPDPRAYDVRVHLALADAAGRSFAEGVAEAGGEVAVVRAGLGQGALLAATAVAHEALHAVGASDKYDAGGHAVAPAGLYQPDRSPPYPQARAELMAAELPLAPGRGRLPESAEEVGVGPATALELGWPGCAAP